MKRTKKYSPETPLTTIARTLATITTPATTTTPPPPTTTTATKPPTTTTTTTTTASLFSLIESCYVMSKVNFETSDLKKKKIKMVWIMY